MPRKTLYDRMRDIAVHSFPAPVATVDPDPADECAYCADTGWFYGNRDLGRCPCAGGIPEPTIAIGPHRLYFGDAYALVPILGRFDVLCMDPQYDFNNSGGGHWRKARRGGAMEIHRRGLDKGFNFEIIDPVLCGSVVAFCHDNSVPSLGAYLREKFHRAVLLHWIKENPAPHRNKHYLADEEFYYHAWARGSHPVGPHEAMRRSITCASVPSKRFGHPTVKPAPVMDKIMANVNGETVCDPFMGTGSTGVAAVKAGKIFTGIENDEASFNMAILRLYEAVYGSAAL